MREIKLIFQFMTCKFMHISTISVIFALHYMNYKLIKKKKVVFFFLRETCPNITKR